MNEQSEAYYKLMNERVRAMYGEELKPVHVEQETPSLYEKVTEWILSKLGM